MRKCEIILQVNNKLQFKLAISPNKNSLKMSLLFILRLTVVAEFDDDEYMNFHILTNILFKHINLF